MIFHNVIRPPAYQNSAVEFTDLQLNAVKMLIYKAVEAIPFGELCRNYTGDFLLISALENAELENTDHYFSLTDFGCNFPVLHFSSEISSHTG